MNMNLLDVTFDAFTYQIESGKIREFVLAVGDDNPLYVDRNTAMAAGYRDIPIPPTFATVIDMWAGANFDELVSRLQLNPLKVLHGEQQYTYIEPICAGDVLYGKTHVTAVTEKANMKLITLETTYVNQNQHAVLIATSVVIELA